MTRRGMEEAATVNGSPASTRARSGWFPSTRDSAARRGWLRRGGSLALPTFLRAGRSPVGGRAAGGRAKSGRSAPSSSRRCWCARSSTPERGSSTMTAVDATAAGPVGELVVAGAVVVHRARRVEARVEGVGHLDLKGCRRHPRTASMRPPREPTKRSIGHGKGGCGCVNGRRPRDQRGGDARARPLPGPRPGR